MGGTAALLDLARREGVRRFIYLSAVSAVYPVKNAYGQSKAEAEALVAGSGLDFTILRLTMIYGEGGGLHFGKLVRLVERILSCSPSSGRAGHGFSQFTWTTPRAPWRSFSTLRPRSDARTASRGRPP